MLPILPILPTCLVPILPIIYPFCSLFTLGAWPVCALQKCTQNTSSANKNGQSLPIFTHFLPISYTVQVLISVLRQLYLFLYSLELSYKKVPSTKILNGACFLFIFIFEKYDGTVWKRIRTEYI